MPKRKEPELTPKEQFKRFQETAKELGVEESASKIEKAFRNLAQSSDQSGRPLSIASKRRS